MQEGCPPLLYNITPPAFFFPFVGGTCIPARKVISCYYYQPVRGL